MATRANVRIRHTGLEWEEEVQLYHHWDGYPSHILPLMARCFEIHRERRGDSCNWELGRAGKLASYIIATDPGGFEPEQGLDLHGDIAFLYVITAVNRQGAPLTEAPEVLVEVYTTWGLPEQRRAKFWEEADPALLRKVAGPLPLRVAAAKAKEIQALAEGKLQQGVP